MTTVVTVTVTVTVYDFPAPLMYGLVAYWPGNEANGNLIDAHGDKDVADQTVIGNDTGHVYATARELNNGESDWFSRDDEDLESVEAFTAAMWLYPYSLSGVPGQYRGLMSNNNVADLSAGWQVFLNHVGEIVVNVSDGGGEGSFTQWHTGESITDMDEWHSLVVWHDPINDLIGVKVNNDASVTTAYSNGLGTSSRDFCIGRYSSVSDAHYYDGQFGPAAVWERVLYADDLTGWWNSGNGLTYSEMAAYTGD